MATPIKVVLKTTVETLGEGGDIVRVRPGYARNFLVPRGLAVLATPANLARVEELKKAAQAQLAKQVDEAKDLKQKLEAASVRLERATGDDGKMYGSVTARDIEEAFSALGLIFDRKKLVLSEPIKQLGLAEVQLKLVAEVIATLRVEVVKKGA